MRVKLDESKIGLLYNNKIENCISDKGLWVDILDKVDNDVITNYDNSKLKLVDILCIIYDFSMVGKITEMKHKNNKQKIVLLLGFNIYPDLFSLSIENQIKVINDIKVADGILTTGLPEKQYFKYINEKIEWVGIPFVRDNIDSFKCEKEKDLICISVGDICEHNYNNHISCLNVIEKVRENINDNIRYTILSKINDSDKKLIQNTFNSYIDIPNNNITDYYNIISKSSLLINLSVNYTFGRIVGESALLNTPCMGSDRVDLQNLLFPQIKFDVFNIDGLYSLLKYIYRNPNYYKSIINYAQCRIADYNVKVIKRRFFDSIINLVGE